MKLFAILVTITLVAVLGVSCTPPPTMVGCYVDSTGFYDLSYDGPMGGVGSFANATLWNSDDGTCSLGRRLGVTLVLASSASEALTACTTAPDATATSVLPMDELNWEGLHGKNLWICGTTDVSGGQDAVAQGRSGARPPLSNMIMVMNAFGSWKPRALARMRPIEALLDSAIPLVKPHSMVASIDAR